MTCVEHQLARGERDRDEELRVAAQEREQPLLNVGGDARANQARRESLRQHRRRGRVAVVQLVAAAQCLDHDLVAVDPAELLDRSVESRRRLVAQPAEPLEDILARHAEDERASESLHQEVEGTAIARRVFDDDHRGRGGDRAGAAGHRGEVLCSAEHQLVDRQPFELGCAGERRPEQW